MLSVYSCDLMIVLNALRNKSCVAYNWYQRSLKYLKYNAVKEKLSLETFRGINLNVKNISFKFSLKTNKKNTKNCSFLNIVKIWTYRLLTLLIRNRLLFMNELPSSAETIIKNRILWNIFAHSISITFIYCI